MQYGIANIPPVVMFNAKIFKPSRLCAVYKVEGLSGAAKEVLQDRILRVRCVRPVPPRLFKPQSVLLLAFVFFPLRVLRAVSCV